MITNALGNKLDLIQEKYNNYLLPKKEVGEKINVAILMSGVGTNTEAIVNYHKANKNKLSWGVKGIVNAGKRNLSYLINGTSYSLFYGNQSSPDFFSNTKLFLKKHKIDLVVCAGFMKILPESIVESFYCVNLHPSLLSPVFESQYKGLNAIERQLIDRVKTITSTFHVVTKDVDGGPVLGYSEPYEVLYPETREILSEDFINNVTLEIKKREGKAFPDIINNIVEGNCGENYLMSE